MSLLVPARDEAHRIAPTVRSLVAQHDLEDMEILVLDAGSADSATLTTVLGAVAAGDSSGTHFPIQCMTSSLNE